MSDYLLLNGGGHLLLNGGGALLLNTSGGGPDPFLPRDSEAIVTMPAVPEATVTVPSPEATVD